MSGDPEQEYFSDGIQPRTSLPTISKISALSVIARNNLVHLQGKAVKVQNVAKSSVRFHSGRQRAPAGARVRVTGQIER